MTEHYKLRMKIGDAEFEADGPKDDVKTLFEQWRTLVESAIARKSEAGSSKKSTDVSVSDSPADEALVKRVFVDRDGTLSLLGLPKSENAIADALVLLVYGYRLLKQDEYPVTGVRLMQAAQQSGVKIDRADRAIAGRKELLVTTGYKRSKRYSLNNRGEQHAMGLMKQLFE